MTRVESGSLAFVEQCSIGEKGEVYFSSPEGIDNTNK